MGQGGILEHYAGKVHAAKTGHEVYRPYNAFFLAAVICYTEIPQQNGPKSVLTALEVSEMNETP